jgi:hypothetical protein
MPSTSKKQQRFFGLVKAIQEGKATGSGKAEEAAESMSKKDVSDFASTEHKGLPEKRSEGAPRTRAEHLQDLALLSAGLGLAGAGGYGITKLVYDNFVRPGTVAKLERQMMAAKGKRKALPPQEPSLASDGDDVPMLSDDSAAESSLTPEELLGEDLEDKSKTAGERPELSNEELIAASKNPLNNPFVYGAALPLAAAVPGIAAFVLSKKLIDKARAAKLDSDVEQAKEEFEQVLKKTGSDLQCRVDALYKQAATDAEIAAKRELARQGKNPASVDINVKPGLVPGADNSAVGGFLQEAGSSVANSELGSKLLTYLGLPLGVGAIAGYMYINNKMKKNPELRKRKELQSLLKRDLAAQTGEQGIRIKEDPEGNKYIDM